MLALISLGAAPKDKPSPPEPLEILPAELVWMKTLGATPSADAAMDDERVYVPLSGVGVRAFIRESGEVAWTEPAETRWPLLVAQGVLFTALPDEIRGRAAATGALRWSHRLADAAMSAPLLWGDGILVVPFESGELRALGADDGRVRWTRALDSPTRHPPAFVPGGGVAVSLADGRLVVIDLATGEVRWSRTIEGSLSAPSGARERVFVGSTNNFFYAFDADRGREQWRWRTGGDVVGGTADGDRVYFASLDNVLRAVNRGNGNQLWKKALATRPAAPPMAFRDVVVVPGVAPRFDAFAGETGAALGVHAAPTDLQGAPLIDVAPRPFEVAVVALTRDGRITALRPTQLTFPDPPLAPLLKLPGRELPREPLPIPRS